MTNKSYKYATAIKLLLLLAQAFCISNAVAQLPQPSPHFVPIHCTGNATCLGRFLLVSSEGYYYTSTLSDTMSDPTHPWKLQAKFVPAKFNYDFEQIWSKAYACDTNKPYLTIIAEINPTRLLGRSLVKCSYAYGLPNPDTSGVKWTEMFHILDTAGNILRSCFVQNSTLAEGLAILGGQIYLGYSAGAAPVFSVPFTYGSGVLCLDTNLNFRWNVVYKNYLSSIYSKPLTDMQLLPNGHLIGISNARAVDPIFAGGTPDTSSTAVIFEFDSTGQIFWVKRYGCGALYLLSSSPDLRRIFKDKYEPYYYIIGDVGCSGGNCFDTLSPAASSASRIKTWVIKIDTLGNIMWSRAIGVPLPISAKDKYNYRMSVQANNEIFILSNLYGNDSCAGDSVSKADFWCYSIDSNGNMVQNWRYNGQYSVLDLDYDPRIQKVIFSFENNGTVAWPAYGLNNNNCYNGTGKMYFGYFDWYPTEVQANTIASDIPLIYPNPASSSLTIESPQWPGRVYMYNMQGQIVGSHDLQNAKQTIKLNNISPGNYLVQVVAGTLNYALQVVVE
jgi:hypothetical protein